MKKHLLGFLVAVLALAGGVSSYSYGAYYIGKAEAHLDLLRGKYNLRTYGTPANWRDEYREILLRDHGVELVEVAGCTVTDELVEKARGYNEVSEAAIERRYGQGAPERAWRRAQQAHESERDSRARE